MITDTLRGLFGTVPPGAAPLSAADAAGERRLLIDGALREATGGATFENVDPSTEQVLGVTADASAEDMARAVAAARRAFDAGDWSRDGKLRAACLRQLKDGLLAAAEELRPVIVAEVGCTLGMTYGEQLDDCLPKLDFIADLAEGYAFQQRQPDRAGHGRQVHRVVRREPYGVVAAITPWNFPVDITIGKLCGALAGGNTVVLKPAPTSPWTATLIGRVIAEATDIPPGVVNIVPTSDNAIAERVVADPRVDLVTFTGSTQTGRRVMARAAEAPKKVILELGGKSANIVLDDEDLERRVPVAGGYVCFNAGQGCLLPTRLLVPRTRYTEAVELLRETFAQISVGDPFAPETVLGPVNNARQLERVLGYIERGKAEGATLVVGGQRSRSRSAGFFVEPTVFADVEPTMTIAREEIFGPVLSVIAYDDDDDAVRIANGTDYGLAGFVWSGSPERALGIAERLTCGSVAVNGGSFMTGDVPFGGFGRSGFGREWGVAGLEEYTQTKTIAW